MRINDYCEQVENTRAELRNNDVDNVHMLFGIITEVGELMDAFKKNMAYGKDIDWVNVEEEIGDLMWYIAGFCNINDMDLEEILQKNVDKLKARYPEKFSKEKAINRDLEKERRILEGTSRLEPMDIYEIKEDGTVVFKNPTN